MEIDWSLVKKRTLWHYEDLIKKMLNVLNYDFVQEHYNHKMKEAVLHSEKIRQGYLQNGKEAFFIAKITEHFRKLDFLRISDYQDLVQRVNTRDKCEAFLRETGFGFGALIQVLNYLFRWVLPFRCPVRELVGTLADADETYMEVLKTHKIRCNLDVLENYRIKSSRVTFSKETGVTETTVLELVHRADISRLAYVRGKTIKHLCGGGYDTLGKIAAADRKKMEADMTAYYATIGKSFSDFKTVIPLDWMIGGAGVLPRVVEE
jgi:hypothetical protein